MKYMVGSIAQVIEDQEEIIKQLTETTTRQADIIYRLSLLLLQHCEVTMEEINTITKTKEKRKG